MEEKSYSYLLSFSRHGAPVWLAHLDLMRIFERSLRRAGFKQLWSKGFNPRPALVFALPLGVGIECEEELLEIVLEEAADPAGIPERMCRALPPGLAVTKAIALEERGKSLMSMVQAAEYRFEGTGAGCAFQAIWDSKAELIAEREHKGKIRTFDLRALIFEREILSDHAFRIRSAAGSSENLRPDLVMQALYRYGALSEAEAEDIRITRERLILDVPPLF